MEVIRKMVVLPCKECPQGVKCTHNLDSRSKYCLLELSKSTLENPIIGPMIDVNFPKQPQNWHHFKIIEKFESKEDAEKYSKENDVEIVVGFVD